MGSCSNLTWVSSLELFEDLDLDLLYVRQVQILGGPNYVQYPYILLINANKATLGINLGNDTFGSEDPLPSAHQSIDGDILVNFLPKMGGLTYDELNDSTLRDKNNLDTQSLIKPKKTTEE